MDVFPPSWRLLWFAQPMRYVSCIQWWHVCVGIVMCMQHCYDWQRTDLEQQSARLYAFLKYSIFLSSRLLDFWFHSLAFRPRISKRCYVHFILCLAHNMLWLVVATVHSYAPSYSHSTQATSLHRRDMHQYLIFILDYSSYSNPL